MSNDMSNFRIAMLIKDINSKMTTIISGNIKDCGLTHQQVTVMKLIGHNGKVTVSHLCEEMSLSKGTVSGIVQRLERDGYIQKDKSNEDKRNTYITFTDKGVKFAKEFKKNINESYDKVFENLTKEEINEIQKALQLLAGKIKNK